jgi:hypothetical protein
MVAGLRASSDSSEDSSFTECIMFGVQDRPKQTSYRCGDVVMVKGLREILASLDAHGTCEGLPFMAEMAPYCGKKLRVSRRVEHVYIDHLLYSARLENTVILEDLRCDGSRHGDCQMGCHLMWKESWLSPEDATPSLPTEPEDLEALQNLPAENDGALWCQATQLPRITTRLAWWDVRQYWRGLRAGNFTFLDLIRMAALLVYNKIRWWTGRMPSGMLSGTRQKTVSETLNLQPGEWVEVKSREEIEATLDVHGKTRGLAFVAEMSLYCGKRYRVARRVDRMIQEDTGEMRGLKDTVALDEVTCMGLAQRRCPRGCFHLWRENWLKRVPAEDQATLIETPPLLPILYSLQNEDLSQTPMHV